MSRQLLVYESAIPLTPARHGRHSVEVGRTYGFSADVNAVPLMAVELVRAVEEYAVVFTQAGDSVMPAAILGLRGDQNLFVDKDGHWGARYVPAFLRRYPFVFAASADQQSLTLCIDETYPGLNTEGRGERLFQADGSPTAYLAQVLEFVKEYQAQFVRTQAFGQRLVRLGLLTPMQAQLTAPGGRRLSLSGLLVVDRARLRDLPPPEVQALARTDELELLYLHLYSLRNLHDVQSRLVEADAQATASA